MKCIDCGAPVKIRTNQTVAYDFGGLPDVALRGIDVRVCPNGHSEYVIPFIEGLHKAIVNVLSIKPSRLAPGEIRFMRKYLGWSQADFGVRRGVTPESVSRWESGSVLMSSIAERLIRLMVLTVEPVSDYRILDLFAKLKDKRDPAKVKMTHKANTWKADVAWRVGAR
jgi:putative zinc finger/helix-turn-helix YgiT family protein